MSCSCQSNIKALKAKIDRLENLIIELKKLELQGTGCYDNLNGSVSNMETLFINGKTYDEGVLSKCVGAISNSVSTCAMLRGKCNEEISKCYEEIRRINNLHSEHIKDEEELK